MPRCLARYIQQARAVFAREALPLSPPQPPPTRRGFASLLLSLEPLPLEPEAARSDRPRLLTLLFAPERLPQYPESPRAPRRTRWFRWVFVPEPIDGEPHGPEVD